MTDQEVINVLAKRLDWYPINLGGVVVYRCDGRTPANQDLLDSRDALAPILEKMIDSEWIALHAKLVPMMDNQALWGRRITKFTLTLPARDLAHAIAEAIK